MKILLNQSDMIRYYDDFEPVQFKYKLLLDDIKDDDTRLDTYLDLQAYESERQFAELTKKEFWDLQENLDMSYANSRITDNYLVIYELMCEKIVRNYIHIDGMERLFSEKYAEFEWEMHLGMDYKKHSMDYYRDHLIHQVRDAYTMEMLLEQCGFYDKIRGILSDEGTSKIAQYVNKMISQQLRLPKILPCEVSDQELLREHYMYNIIHMSSYISGLFHDIGYPAAMALKASRRMVDYLVEMHHFEQGTYDFRQITSLLQNSLLFRVVPPREIRGRIESDKVDHGVMSAMLLLLHFYENGAIHRLEPYKLCAVEMAALAIYNHTNKYAYIGDQNPEYERAVFTLNPISYLLRISDDIQEWGRIYFEVSGRSNMILCDRCKMPIIRRRTEEDEDGVDYDVVYQCCCRDEESKSLFAPMFRYKQFPYRRIYNITVCNGVEIETGDYLRYRIRFKYDLDRLLHIAYINPEYARYRSRDLAKVKRLFPRQYGIERVFLDYFMTANIILIKSVIVGKYIESLAKKQESADYYWEDSVKAVLAGMEREKLTANDIGVIRDALARLVDELLGKYETELYDAEKLKGLERDQRDKYTGYLHRAFSIYVFIFLLTCTGKEVNTKKYIFRKCLCDQLWEMLQMYLSFKDMTSFCSEEVNVLLKDCCVQAGKMFGDLDSYLYYPDAYFDMCCADGACYSAVRRLTNIDNYHHLIDQTASEPQLDAYTDLYFIRMMLKKIV